MNINNLFVHINETNDNLSKQLVPLLEIGNSNVSNHTPILICVIQYVKHSSRKRTAEYQIKNMNDVSVLVSSLLQENKSVKSIDVVVIIGIVDDEYKYYVRLEDGKNGERMKL